jgi:hypothetical protein
LPKEDLEALDGLEAVLFGFLKKSLSTLVSTDVSSTGPRRICPNDMLLPTIAKISEKKQKLNKLINNCMFPLNTPSSC